MNEQTVNLPLAISIAEAARLSSCGRSTIYSEIANGSLKRRKIGRRSVIALDDLREWLASKTGEATQHD